MKINQTYDVHFLHTMPYLVILAVMCLGALKNPEFLMANASAMEWQGRYMYGDSFITEKSETPREGLVRDDDKNNSSKSNSAELQTRLSVRVVNDTEKVNHKRDEVKEERGRKVEEGIKDINKVKHKREVEAGREAEADREVEIGRKAAYKKENVEKMKKATVVEKVDNIKIAGRNLAIFKSNYTLTDSGDMVALYGDKFLYGHNTDNVFLGLKYMREGDRFSARVAGVDSEFIVAKKTVMTKDRTADFMDAIVDARFMGEQYDLSLMTCEGEARPNRDATHRLVMFAKRV